MKASDNLISWAMRNYRITFLITIVLFVFGVFALDDIPKQEFPEYTIRQGVVIGVYPGATSEEVEEQLAKPLEQFLMTYKEVKRSKTTSTSQNGACVVMVELHDHINNKDEVWSKIKHGLTTFKQQLPQGVLAVVANDDFGDTSALLITIESDYRSYRELEEYLDELSARLRRVESVSNIRPFGVQKEQISIYLNPERLAAYGIGEKSIAAKLASQGLTSVGGSISNAETETPIHLSPSLTSEEEVANLIVWSQPDGKVLRIKDIARVIREWDEPDSYILNNGHRCVLLSMEMIPGHNIVEYGETVDEVLQRFDEEVLPEDVRMERIADQAKVVGESVSSFLRDLFVAMAIIVGVMMLLFPLRSAIVAAITIPLSTFISVAVMYMCGIPLNQVTLAALVVVLGMIVDNSIVVIDGYLEYLGKGYSRWYAAAVSAMQYFPSLLLATVCICMIFYPLLLTMSGMLGEFVEFFPWTITINLMVSLILSVAIIPLLEYVLIPRLPEKKPGKKSMTDRVQEIYNKALGWTFRHGWLTISLGFGSTIVALLLVLTIDLRMFPYADRDQFAVEIFLPNGTPLERTEAVADSLYRVLSQDERITSITSFIGCSSPRFQMSYAPQMAGKNFAQFIVNTRSIDTTVEILDDYADQWADHFADAYIKFKQLDFQTTPSFEFRFYGEDLDSLQAVSDRLMDYLRTRPELTRIHTDFEDKTPIVDVTLHPVTASRLGINRTIAAANLTLATGDLAIGSVWEEDYDVPVVIKMQEKDDKLSLQDVGDVRMASPIPTVNVPLRQMADIETKWSYNKIVHRNGRRCMSVTAEPLRGVNAMSLTNEILDYINGSLEIPVGVEYETGGAREFDLDEIPPILSGVGISLIIIFFFILINFRKFGISLVVMASMTLCLFGAILGLALADYTVGLTSIFGFITLLGMIVRNAILIYQHAEEKRKFVRLSAREAAYDAGARRMVPIFLTTATTAAGVVPMILGGTTFWAPVGITIFAGGIGSLILVVMVLPVLYTKIYK